MPGLFHVSQEAFLSRSRFFKVQVKVLEVALELIIALSFSLLRHDIYDCNFSSSLSVNVRKYTHQT